MYEEEFLEKLYNGISQRLRSSNESRTFYTQSTINLNKNNGGDGIHDISDSVEDSLAPMIVTEAVFPQENDRLISPDNVSNKSEESRRKIVRINDENTDNNSIKLRDSNEYDQDEESPIVSSSSRTNHSSSIATSKTITSSQRTSKTSSSLSSSSSSSSNATKPQNKLVRTDPLLLKINAFFRPAIAQSSSQPDSDGDIYLYLYTYIYIHVYISMFIYI
jgi:primase-polymerase (primpol)-like protein